MSNTILIESTSYQKKYKCPYCDKRFTRMDLVKHIDKKHGDMIPKDYTATRVVFNLINKKEYGTCVMCGKKTNWDENKARYDRFCGSKACHDKYVKIAHKNTDIENKLKDPEFQTKMLAGRSISGSYKFSTDGGSVSYTGTYERKFLEFMDKLLNIKSYDLDAPGPTIEYEYDGETHFWITDYRYIPYNLVFDIKDGGDNPNNRVMTDYRAKQVAKERAIAKQGKYNYIRLTNNNFEQLIDIFLELKEMLGDENKIKKPIIKINEHSTMLINTLPPVGNDVYIIDYMKKNSLLADDHYHHYGLCKDYMQDAITVKNGVFESLSFDSLKEMDVKLYKYSGDANFMSIVEEAENDTDFYKLLTEKDLLDPMQLDYDPLFEEVFPYSVEVKIMEESIIASHKSGGETSVLYEGVQLPYFEVEPLNESGQLVKVYRDIDGAFLMNESSGMRTKSYKDPTILKKFRTEISNLLR